MAAKFLTVFLTLLAVAAAEVAVFRRCDKVSQDPCTITELRITPCRKSPCVLKKGRNASLEFDFTPRLKALTNHHHHHQPINVPTAGAQAFPMDGIGRLGHGPPRGPTDWWVLTTANAAGTNGLTCLPKHGGARDSKFLVTHPMTDHCESCLTSTIAAERASHLRHRAPHIFCTHKNNIGAT
ncbi:hypothetical protein evm_012046 [Chilo suppressalis]|nr:hypothetical protein evm_012046 [Chilo suppressalis]